MTGKVDTPQKIAASRQMEPTPDDTLAAEVELALNYFAPDIRNRLRTFFAFDRRLARIVGGATEPMLARMRLQWWRDELDKKPEARPQGDAVLDALGRGWAGAEAALVALVNGWECLLDEPPLSREAAELFARGRAAPFKVLAVEGLSQEVERAAMTWALADAAVHSTSQDDRQLLTALSTALPQVQKRLPRNVRGLAVLRALANRSIASGNRPLLGGRGAALTALRAGLLGR